MTARHPRGAAVLLIVGAGAAFATSGPLARYARPADPLVIAGGRCALAALVLLAVDLPGVLRAVASLGGRRLAGIGAAGALLGAHLMLFLVGLDATSLPAAVALVSLEPVSVVLWSWLLHGLRPTGHELVGVVAATAGAVVVATATGAGEHRLTGDLIVVGAVLLYGPYVSIARYYATVLPARRYASLVYLAAAVVIALTVAVVRAGRTPWLGPLPTHSLLAIAGIALLPTLVGHTAVQSAARRISPSLVALVSPMETVGAIAIGAALLATRPTLRELIGALVIMAGVTIAILGTRAPVEEAEY